MDETRWAGSIKDGANKMMVPSVIKWGFIRVGVSILFAENNDLKECYWFWQDPTGACKDKLGPRDINWIETHAGDVYFPAIKPILIRSGVNLQKGTTKWE